jgi:hypothetical protein
LVLIAVVLFSEIGGFAEARFDLRNLERTKRWALQQYLSLVRLRREGNTMRVAEATKELEHILQANEGKAVRWRIAVVGVTTGSVFLQSSHSEQVRELSRSQFEPTGEAEYMAIGFEEDLREVAMDTGYPGVGIRHILSSIGAGVPSTINGIPCRMSKVQIGRHIASTVAANLKNGDYVTVQATIGKTGVSHDSILIRLDQVSVSE